MTRPIQWGIIAAGNIAKAFANGLDQTDTGTLVAVGSRSKEKATQFGQEFGVDAAKCYGSYDDLLADGDVDAVYIATPHPMHVTWCVRAAEAGKHILCEKPLTLNHASAMIAVEAARRAGVMLMEAFMYRAAPQTRKLVELVKRQAIGELRLIRATFSFHGPADPTHRLMANELGGGGILDVGCYTVSMARLLAGAAMGKDFADPVDVCGAGRIGETGVDEYAAATLKFPGDIVAQLSTGVQLNQDNALVLFGEKGQIRVNSPWLCHGKEAGSSSIELHQKGHDPEKLVVQADKGIYALEIEAAAEAIHAGRPQPLSPAMGGDDTLGNMKTLDRWRAAMGQQYEQEKPDNITQPLHGFPLSRKSAGKLCDIPMQYAPVSGLDQPVARLVMGMPGSTDFRHASTVWDDYFELGGNCYDTARVYGPWEGVLGRWIEQRGIRDQVMIIDKGAHTPNCYPKAMTEEFMTSLENLRTDYVDIYFLHRDNPEVPVGEFVDVLNEHRDAGRIKIFGGSNWSPERVDAANEYAKKNGKQGFTAVSNNMSLAHMVDPVWADCLTASEPTQKAWFEKTQTPLFAWSSQARGFFVEGRAHPEKREDAELVRCWYSPENFQRLERAKEMAAKHGVRPINIAAAYVLCQPFPTFALIGPQTLNEVSTSMPALSVQLTPEEVAYLNLERDSPA